MLLVKSIERKETVSKSNGKTYVSYKLKGAYKNENDGLMYGANVVLDSKAIDSLISIKKITSANDLVGHEVQLARLYPVFLTDYEKNYGLRFDSIISIK